MHPGKVTGGTGPEAFRARLLIYTNVGSDISPSRESGWQMLMQSVGVRSQGPETEEAADILRQYPHDFHQAKHVYTRVPSGDVILARLLALTGARATDSFGRGGLHLGQALILKEESFASMGCDPFLLFEGGLFVDTPEDAVKKYGFTAQPTDLTLNPGLSTKPRSVDDPQLWQRLRLFAKLAIHLRAGDLPYIQLVGSSAGMSRVLSFWFAVMPEELRRECTFDTAVAKPRTCTLRIRGATPGQPDQSALTLDCDQLTVTGELPKSRPSRFLSWLSESAEGKALTPDAASLRKLRAAYYLDRFWTGRDCAPAEMTDVDDALAAALGVGPEDIEQRVDAEAYNCFKAQYAPAREALLTSVKNLEQAELVRRVRGCSLLLPEDWTRAVDAVWEDWSAHASSVPPACVKAVVAAADAEVIPETGRLLLELMRDVLTGEWGSAYMHYWQERPLGQYGEWAMEFLLEPLSRGAHQWEWKTVRRSLGQGVCTGPALRLPDGHDTQARLLILMGLPPDMPNAGKRRFDEGSRTTRVGQATTKLARRSSLPEVPPEIEQTASGKMFEGVVLTADGFLLPFPYEVTGTPPQGLRSPRIMEAYLRVILGAILLICASAAVAVGIYQLPHMWKSMDPHGAFKEQVAILAKVLGAFVGTVFSFWMGWFAVDAGRRSLRETSRYAAIRWLDAVGRYNGSMAEPHVGDEKV